MNKLKIHFLNTIWSDAIILEKNKHFAFIDTGSKFYYPMIKDYLDLNNIKKLDFIFLSHFHNDHYGNIENIMSNYDVDKIYLKHYYGLDGTTSSGFASNDEYIENEFNNYNNILSIATNNDVEIIYIDDITNNEFIINFHNTLIDVFDYNNRLYELYSNPSSNYYKQKMFNENFNSTGLFIKENNYNIFLGGDVTCSTTDIPELKELSIKMIHKIYKKYNINHIDIYKSCHHGGGGTNTSELCNLIRPNYTIITNTDRWLNSYPTFENLKNANPNVKILKTDYHKYIFTIDNDINYQDIFEESLFITLKKD